MVKGAEIMIIPNDLYDILKWICIVVLPALACCYSALAAVWNFPLAEEIPQTILIIQTFIGALLGISSAQYYKATGSIEMPDDEVEVDNHEIGEG